MEDAYQVGAALAYLVRRMPGFCGISGESVFMRIDRDGRGDLPERMPASTIIDAQANNYNVHRKLYPVELRELLDRGVRSAASDPDGKQQLKEGFLSALAT